MKDGGLADAVECFCYLRNVQDLLTDRETPHERRFGEPFKGPIIPCGSVENFKANRESLNRQNLQMTLRPVPTSGRSKVTSFIYRHHNEPRVQLYVSKEETFIIPLNTLM